MRQKKLLHQTIGGLILAALFLNGCGAPKPILRLLATCAVVDGKVYVIGGIARNDESTSVVEEFDPSTDQWASGASMPTPRAMASAVTIDGRIYIFGGRNTSGIMDTVEVYDPASNSWEKVTTMPQARWNHMVAEVQGKIYVIGGIVGTGDNRRSIDTVEIYDPTENTWKLGQSLPTSRQGAAIAVVQEKIYVIGGKTGAGASGTITKVVEVYDPLEDYWRSIQTLVVGRSSSKASVVDGRIYVIGGSVKGGGVTGSIEKYDPAIGTWEMMAQFLQEPRTGHCVASLGSRTYVIGGTINQSYAGVERMVEELTVK